MKRLSINQTPKNQFGQRSETRRMLLPAIILMGIVLLGTLVFVIDIEKLFLNIERPYLIPWVLAMGATLAAPSLYLWYRGEFKLTHPLVFATFTYFFPIFFLGGWSLTLGLSNYYYLNYVSDPEYNFPLTFVYAIVGFAALSVGFFIPLGKKIGNYLGNKLPVWNFNAQEAVLPSFYFLGAGVFLSILALGIGQIGYQRSGMIIGITGSLNYYLTMVIPASTIILWLAFFKIERWNAFHLIIAAAQVLIALFMLFLLGGRSSLLNSLLFMVLAYTMAGRKFHFKQITLLSIFVPLFLIIGMIYGTTFRNLKTNDDRVSVEEYASIAVDTLDTMGEQDWSKQIGEAFDLLAERLEIVSSLGVVVSNYERVKPYEAAYGLENNIWTYTWTAFIPRFIWNDKPLIADNYSYNELYFDHGGYGLAITAMGDLLRNFGPYGVPLGMLLLGFGIRILYAMLIEGFTFSIWKSTIYLTIVSKISYDSFYGEIFPTVIRVAVVIFVQLFILKTIIYALRFRER